MQEQLVTMKQTIRTTICHSVTLKLAAVIINALSNALRSQVLVSVECLFYM